MNLTLLVTNLCSYANVHLALDFLHVANSIAAQSERINIHVASLDGGPVYNAQGRELKVDLALTEIAKTDIVLIPGYINGIKEVQASFDKHSAWLNYQYKQGAYLVSMCTAVFMLAKAGVLNATEVTTHWAYRSKLEREFPALKLNKSREVCEHNRIITSAGASASVSLLLYMVRRFISAEVAMECSELFYTPPLSVEQSEYPIWTLPKYHGDKVILEIQEWMEVNMARRILIPEICEKFGFGERNFKRRFVEATGHPPLSYLQLIRIEEAKRLLEVAELSLDEIIKNIGYEDTSSFRRLFKERVGISPAKYRKAFLVKA